MLATACRNLVRQVLEQGFASTPVTYSPLMDNPCSSVMHSAASPAQGPYRLWFGYRCLLAGPILPLLVDMHFWWNGCDALCMYAQLTRGWAYFGCPARSHIGVMACAAPAGDAVPGGGQRGGERDGRARARALGRALPRLAPAPAERAPAGGARSAPLSFHFKPAHMLLVPFFQSALIVIASDTFPVEMIRVHGGVYGSAHYQRVGGRFSTSSTLFCSFRVRCASRCFFMQFGARRDLWTAVSWP